MAGSVPQLRRIFTGRTLVPVAVAVFAVAALGVVAVLLPSNSKAATDTSLRFTVKQTLTSFNVVDANAKGWTPGDATTYTKTFRDLEGRVVGQADGDCLITRVANGHPTAAECGQTFRFKDGMIQTNTVDLITPAKQTMAMTGGTGRYQNMTGEIRAGYACGDCFTFVLSR